MEWEKYPRIIRNIIFFTERILLNYVDHFIVVSELMRKLYSEYLTNQINVIGNYYDEYRGEKKDLRKIYSLGPDQIILDYFGGINLKSRTIDKIIGLIQKCNNIHFFISGSGVETLKVTEFTKRKRNIYFLGWLENVREYVDSLDYFIYVMNTDKKYYEFSAPNTLYLAISHNKPIITNVTGEPLELIKKYSIGYYIEDLDQLDLRDLDFTKDYKTFTKNIAKIKNNYLWSSSSQIYAKIFNTNS